MTADVTREPTGGQGLREEWLTKLAGAAGCRWWKDDPVCDEHGEEWPCKGDALLIVAQDFATALAPPPSGPRDDEES